MECFGKEYVLCHFKAPAVLITHKTFLAKFSLFPKFSLGSCQYLHSFFIQIFPLMQEVMRLLPMGTTVLWVLPAGSRVLFLIAMGQNTIRKLLAIVWIDGVYALQTERNLPLIPTSHAVEIWGFLFWGN